MTICARMMIFWGKVIQRWEVIRHRGGAMRGREVVEWGHNMGAGHLVGSISHRIFLVGFLLLLVLLLHGGIINLDKFYACLI